MNDRMNSIKPKSHKIAYFTMEIGLTPEIPTYSGGLGVLAGDMIRSAADLEVPLVAVTLLTRKGYFRQQFDEHGKQIDTPHPWKIRDYLKPCSGSVTISIEGRTVRVKAWQHTVCGITGCPVRVVFLDTDVAGNAPQDRQLSQRLYGGDEQYRLGQEIVLGMGGVKTLRALGYTHIECFHMNEGHAALLLLELFNEELARTGARSLGKSHIEQVRRKTVFTTHTPVPAGHDHFPLKLARRMIGPHPIWGKKKQWCHENTLNMTYLALSYSRYINAVAEKHGEVSRDMFPAYTIDSITNGVHAGTWTGKPIQTLLDRHLPNWQQDNGRLRYAVSIPKEALHKAHQRSKQQLITHIRRVHKRTLDVDVFTIGFARRATAYKRANLIFKNISQLQRVAAKAGRIQLVFAGKAHPKDLEGQDLIQEIIGLSQSLTGDVSVVYLSNYDMDLAKVIIPGVDLWLNTPMRPLEASGASGMKAALNGVPSLSILDGWWIEGCVENVTGWAIEGRSAARAQQSDRADATALYRKLEKVILPMFYHDQEQYLGIMRNALALNGSFFNTQRMVRDYQAKAYRC